MVSARITWNATGTVTGCDAATCASAALAAAGWRASQPVSLSAPVVRTSSRVMWPVERATAPWRCRQAPAPPTGLAPATGAASDTISTAAHRAAVERTTPRMVSLHEPGSGVGSIRGVYGDRPTRRIGRKADGAGPADG